MSSLMNLMRDHSISTMETDDGAAMEEVSFSFCFSLLNCSLMFLLCWFSILV